MMRMEASLFKTVLTSTLVNITLHLSLLHHKRSLYNVGITSFSSLSRFIFLFYLNAKTLHSTHSHAVIAREGCLMLEAPWDFGLVTIFILPANCVLCLLVDVDLDRPLRPSGIFWYLFHETI